MAASGRVKQIGFDDQTITGGLRDKPEKYEAKAGFTDIIRVMTDPLSYYGANVKMKDSDKGWFGLSLADHDLIESGNSAACAKMCPLFKRGYKITRRFVCLIHHVGRFDKRGKFHSVDRFLPMSFGGERYAQLRSLAAGLPVNEKTKQRYPLRAVTLRVDCTDEQFQKCTFQMNLAKDATAVKFSESKAACADLFDPEGDLNGECSVLSEFLLPEPFNELMDSLDRAEKRGRYAKDGEEDLDAGDLDSLEDPEEGEEEPEPTPAPKAKPKPTAAPAGKPPVRLGKPGAKPAPTPAAKPAAAKPKPKPEPDPEADEALSEDFDIEDLANVDVDD